MSSIIFLLPVYKGIALTIFQNISELVGVGLDVAHGGIDEAGMPCDLADGI